MAAALTAVPAESTSPELNRLAELEAIVERGLPVFVEVGLALSEIRRRRLYRDSHRSFEVYLRERFAMSLPRSTQLIWAAEVAKAITTADGPPVASESALRQVAPVLRGGGPEAARKAWRDVVAEAGERPSAPEVRAVLRRNGASGLPDREALDEAGRRLTTIGRYLERYGTRPLEPELRPVAARYAMRSRALASALDRLAEGETIRPGTLTAPPKPGTVWCDSHGRARDADGTCAYCGVADYRPGR